MPVIAMTQEMATLGKDVALGLCEALGLAQVRHEVGDVVAGRMHVKKSLIRRIREGKAGTIEKWSADDKTISIFTAEEVLDLAVKSNVLIRGWGANLLLEAKVRAGLRADEKTAEVDVSIEVEAGVVRLAGIVATPGERDHAGDVVAAVPGVAKVENALNSMSGGIGRRMFPSGLTR